MNFGSMNLIEQVGAIAATVMPLFNIPLIIKIIQRRSSQDISLSWLFGIWTCTILMAPSGFVSEDLGFRLFNIVNSVLFTGVVIVVLKYRKKA